MNTFNANFSSSPASERLPNNTPQRAQRFYQQSEPSTTPAVPPPSQVFGSSQIGSSNRKLQFSGKSSDARSFAPQTSRSLQQTSNDASLNRPKSRLFQYSTNTDASEAYEHYDEDDMEEDWEDDDHRRSTRHTLESGVGQGAPAMSLLKFSTNSMRKSGARSSRAVQSVSKLPRTGNPDIMPGLARDLTRRAQPAGLKESDTVVLGTEKILRQLDEACANAQSDAEQHIMISGAAQELIMVWRDGMSKLAPHQGHIGPLPPESAFTKARFVATLLLEVYHPQGPEQTQETTYSNSLMAVDTLPTKPMPRILLDWMHRYHSNLDALLSSTLFDLSNPIGTDFFWDAVHTFILHGRFADAMRLLVEADFSQATIEEEGGYVRQRYSGIQLQAIQAAIFAVRQVFNACPAVHQDDWNIDGQEWDLYRKEVEQAMEDLTDMANGYEPGQAARVGLGRPGARPQLPHEVHGFLKMAYSILLGDSETILALAQDWLEASLLLTVWWNGTRESSVEQWSFDVSRANQPSNSETYRDLYLTRIKDAFLCATDPETESNFHLNSLSPVEVGIGCVLQGATQSVLKILQVLSLPIASAVAEIGLWAGWVSTSTAGTGLDSEDLMVLNYGSDSDTVSKDDIVAGYAEALFARDELSAPDGDIVAGWELALAVITRLDDQSRMQKCVADFIDRMSITDRQQAEKLVQVCDQLQLNEQAQKVSETFGDHLVNTSSEFGAALLYYARARAEDKIRQVIDLLNSYCLVQSKSCPTEDEMDQTLKVLVSDPRTALQDIGEGDPAVAEILQFYLAGYACLRKFYTYRDQASVAAKAGQPAATKPIVRKKLAAKALVAAINSAADSIYGGLYDHDRRSAIQVDGLLPLLGEATALLTDTGSARILTSEQMYALLAAIEDLQTVGDRVFRATEECLEASIRNYQGSAPPSPHAMLRKSVSSGTNSNFSFSMMGSEMLMRSEDSLAAKSMGSAVLIGKSESNERGWDWRARFADTTVTASEVLRYLRVGLARELSEAQLEENTGAL